MPVDPIIARGIPALGTGLGAAWTDIEAMRNRRAIVEQDAQKNQLWAQQQQRQMDRSAQDEQREAAWADAIKAGDIQTAFTLHPEATKAYVEFQKLQQSPTDPGPLVSTSEGYQPRAKAIGMMPYQAPPRAPLPRPASAAAAPAVPQGKPPSGYRWTAEGNLEPIPGGPVATEGGTDAAKKATAFELYQTGMEGLMKGLEGTKTGPIAGRLPALSAEQQAAEGGVAAMAPILKQLFRVAGEGVFTDKDQELLLKMIPSRTTLPEARKQQVENIDAIVRAKLGIDSAAPAGAPVPGVTKEGGYIYIGGDPGKRESWVKER